MTVSEKTKIIDNKIQQNIAQYDLDRQTGKISGLSSGNVSKCELKKCQRKKWQRCFTGKRLTRKSC